MSKNNTSTNTSTSNNRNVVVGEARDMSKAWDAGATIYPLSYEDGSPVTVRLENRYIYVPGVNTQFKPSIAIASKLMIEQVEAERTKVEAAGIAASALSDKLELKPLLTNGVLYATLPAQCAIRRVPSLDELKVADIEKTPFNAYTVLTLPFIYVDTAKNTASIPVHVKTLGVHTVDTAENELKSIDVSKLTLAE